MTQPNPTPTIVPKPQIAPRPAAASHGVFLPMLLMALALLVFVALQMTQLIMARSQLSQANANLEPQVQQATKLRNALEALAVATSKLGSEGNVNAQNIVDQLRKRGVTINPPKQ